MYCTPLHFASFFGKAKAIDLLLKRRASVVARDTDNAEALVYAIWGEDPWAAIALLAQGADVNATN
jgi:ankyrin repeat protein